MDVIDLACQREAEDRERAIAAARARPGTASYICIDCGIPIPPARRRAIPGVTRCVDCQSRLEILQRTSAP